MRGETGHDVNYRHIIDWLVRKPGAFEHYRYKDDLFPTSQFRMDYDQLRWQYGKKAGNKQYLKLLELAARDSETMVTGILRSFLSRGDPITFEAVETQVKASQHPPSPTEVTIGPVDLEAYDHLLDFREVFA